MKGDFTRFTFTAAKHYDAVLMQQGRVQTDADWNEQVMIAAYRNRTQLLDIIGPSGAPQDLGSAGKGPFLVYYENAKLSIHNGRYYVDGIMVESEGVVPFLDQPGTALPPGGLAGTFLVYLDIWRRHVTALEDPGIREVALAGADSGTRSQLVWQARMERIGNLGVNIVSIPSSQYGPAWQPTGTASTGLLDVKAGSTPLENQLYRVEVHRGGTSTTASFKWSRDNGTVVAGILTHSHPNQVQVVRNGATVQVWQFSITLDQSGRDSFSSFLPGHMVELSNEEFAFQRKPGVFGTVTSVAGDTLNLEVPQSSAPLTSPDGDLNPLAGSISNVRRWDNPWNPDLGTTTLTNVGPDYTQGGRILLERGITVRFAATTPANAQATYQTGDHWLIPARTVSGLEGWVENQAQSPFGEEHFYAPLALVKIQQNGTVANPSADLRDMRDVFPTLRSLVTGAGNIVQGTGTKDYLPKWQSNGGSVQINSTITDDGTTVKVGSASQAANLEVAGTTALKGTLKVGVAASAVQISRFTANAIHDMAAPELAETVPTSKAVKDCVTRSVPVGTVMAYASETIPPGWLECNGAQLDGAGAMYAPLFQAIGKSFGGGSGAATSFNLPDLRGRFIRGWSHGTGRDPDAGYRTTGDRVGSYQDDTNRSHSHFQALSGYTGYESTSHAHYLGLYEFQVTYPSKHANAGGWIYSATGGNYFGNAVWRQDTSPSYSSHGHSVSMSGWSDPAGGNESRPKNLYLTYIIKY